jgi:hypothetical protein
LQTHGAADSPLGDTELHRQLALRLQGLSQRLPGQEALVPRKNHLHWPSVRVRGRPIVLFMIGINLSQAFAGQKVGVKQVEEKIWLVSFMRYDLSFFDHETCRIESAENPFSAKVSAMSPV